MRWITSSSLTDALVFELSQDAESQARAVLLLQQKVEALEKDLQRKMAIVNTPDDNRDQSRPTRIAPGGKGVVRRSLDRGRLSQTRTHTDEEDLPDDVTNSTRHARHLSLPKTGGHQIIIVDASVLIYSMHSVHEWSKRKDVRLVVPDEGECCDEYQRSQRMSFNHGFAAPHSSMYPGRAQEGRGQDEHGSSQSRSVC